MTQYNNAFCSKRKNPEENFTRGFIVFFILALWEKLCLRCPFQKPTPLACESKSQPTGVPL